MSKRAAPAPAVVVGYSARPQWQERRAAPGTVGQLRLCTPSGNPLSPALVGAALAPQPSALGPVPGAEQSLQARRN
jgi:hypothetical protein